MELKGKRIAYIVSNFPCYSETFVLSELVELKKRGIAVEIFSLRGPREELVQEEARPLLPDTFYSPFILSAQLVLANLYYMLKKPVAYFCLLRELVAGFLRSPLLLIKNLAVWPKSVHFAYAMRGRNLRHIHAHFANYPATAAMIASRLLGVPFSFISHAHDIYVDSTMVDRKIELSKRAFTISHYNKRFLRGKFPALEADRIEVLRASIDTRVFSPAAAGSPRCPLRILAVGRLFPKKGFMYLIQACSFLEAEGLSFLCHIVGEGPEEGSLRDLIGKLRLEGKVVMEGPLTREGVLNLLGITGVFVCPSIVASDVEIQDGIPVVIMEAMAMGIPVVATRVSGIPELVIDGETGLLVESEDPRALAEAIIRLSREGDLRSELSHRGRRKILDEYDVKKNVARLVEIFFSTRPGPLPRDDGATKTTVIPQDSEL